jgi:hypothetical protein
MANQNVTQLVQQTGSAAATSLFYAVTTGSVDTGLPLSVLFNNPAFTGVPTAPTAAVNTSTTQIASTAYVINQGYLTSATAATTYAPLAGATFTGQVNVAYTNAIINANDTSGTGIAKYEFTSNGTLVWDILKGSGATGGFFIERYNAGAFVDNPFQISNVTGVVTMVDGISGSPIGASSPSTGAFTTLSATGNFTPSQTNGIVGTTTNNNANAGSVGEFVTATNSAVSLTSGTAANVSSISLTAGDWDVQGGVQFIPAASTVFTQGVASISTTTATQGALTAGSGQVIWSGSVTAQQQALQTGVSRISLTGTTTVFLVGTAGFTTSTLTANGYIRARRVR